MVGDRKILDEILLPNTEVYGMSRYHSSEGVPTDHIAIYPAKISTVYIDANEETGEMEISYWLKTPDGDDWGDNVPASEVAKTREELLSKIIPEWDKGWK